MELTELILSKGVGIDVEDNASETPLFYAAINGHLEMVKYLVEHGANPVKRANGSMAYDEALKNNHTDVAAFLKPYRDQYYKKFN